VLTALKSLMIRTRVIAISLLALRIY